MIKYHPGFFGVFVALTLILSYVETLIPIPLMIPGAKLGLANLAIILMLYLRGPKEALVLSAVRVVLVGFLFGNMAAIMYSLGGTFLSLGGMWLLKRTNKFSMISISAVGGVLHNIGQFIIAMLVLQSKGLYFYLPFLIIIGCLTGVIIGIVALKIWTSIEKLLKNQKG
ncbi:MAG TPA: Gx transporter family protein [Candidatus Merdenecus merdavium]|nr:Gx transporter family protein [Candidatus Merdenecus merdavium]